MTQEGGVPFGPFILEERLASGGSAEVWTAHFANAGENGSRIVVKRLLPSLLRDQEARGAFAKEAALYARCTPGVCARGPDSSVCPSLRKQTWSRNPQPLTGTTPVAR